MKTFSKVDCQKKHTTVNTLENYVIMHFMLSQLLLLLLLLLCLHGTRGWVFISSDGT